MIVDQNDQEVGIATEPYAGQLLRRIDGDPVVFFASASGLQQGPIDFYHSTTDCSDARYLSITGGAGFAYYAHARGGTLFYTRQTDAANSMQLLAMSSEHFGPDEDATKPGACTPMEASVMAVGIVTTVTDSVLANLVPPLRLK